MKFSVSGAVRLLVFLLGVALPFSPSLSLAAQSADPQRSKPAQASAQVARTFANPPKAYRPMVRWWWPGGDVASAELRHEVDLLDQAGFGGAEIQPFNGGLSPKMPEAVKKKVNDYLTPSFYGHVRAALEEARSRGMWLDYTFGSGWPFGGAGAVTPELSSVELLSAHQTIRGPAHFNGRIQIPQLPAQIAKIPDLPAGWMQRFRKREKLVAVVAWRGNQVQLYRSQGPDEPPAVRKTGRLDPGTAVVLTGHMQPNGTLNWNVPPGVWQVFVFKEMPTGQTVSGGVGAGPQLVLDHMSRHAFEAYAQRVGGTAKQNVGQFFGNGLRAIFCDSLEVHSYLYWDNDFLAQFRKLRGYDLTPYLPLLKVPGSNVPYSATAAGLPLYNVKGIGAQVRRDYWQTVSDVMIVNFYKPFDEWAAANGLLARVQAHGSPTDQLRTYGDANIPETEDLYDNGRYDFLKMASSAGDLYGRNIVASESFVWRGKLYQTTPEKIKRFADELITAGINEIIYHGYPYAYMDRPFPGWDPFAVWGGYSSDMNRTNPFTPYLPRLNGYITRLQYISQVGKTVVPVALYRGKLAYDAIEPAPPEPKIDTRLMAAGYNFDHIDGYTLLKCQVSNGQLVSPGGHLYGALVLPNQETVSVEVAGQLAAFAHEGLPIVFVKRMPDVPNEEVTDSKLKSVSYSDPLRRLLDSKGIHMAANPEDAVQALNTLDVEPNLRFHGTSVPFIEKRIGPLDAFFFRNPGDAPVKLQVEFSAKGAPQRWDPWTGEVHAVSEFRQDGTRTLVQLNLDGHGSALVVFNPKAKTPAESSQARPRRVLAQIDVGENGWKFHGVGIGPGSRPETVDMEFPRLFDWSMNPRLKNFSGRGEYSTSFRLPADSFQNGRHIILDLGDVKDAAQVTINGKPGPVLLVQPYKADVTSLLHAGNNTVKITVTNTLFNAVSARGASEVYSPEVTNTANGLMPSGLIGPVRLEEEGSAANTIRSTR